MSNKTFFEKNLKKHHKDAFYRDGKIFILNRDGYDPGLNIDWLADPFNHRSWRWIFNNFKWMDGLLYDYLFKGDFEAVKRCADFLFSWYNFYILGVRNGEFLWKDDAVSFRAFRVAVVAKYILSSGLKFSENEKEMAKHAISLHYKELLDERKFKRNNHGLFQVRGLMTLSFIHSDLVSLDKARSYAEKQVNYLWPQQYGTQGFHLENSTGYHQFALKEFDEILSSPEFSGTNLFFDKLDIKKAMGNTKYFYHPNGISTLLGDSNLSTKTLPRFKGDRIFNEAGYAFLSGQDDSINNSYLAVRTGFRSHIHRHSDDFSFEWSEMGEVIIQDSGRYSYEYENPYRIFVTSTRAHNTVAINDKNFPWHGSFKEKDFYKGAVEEYECNDNKSCLVLQRWFSDLDVVFKRSLEIEKGKHLIVTDTLTSDLGNTYIQWFHLAEPFDYIGEDAAGSLVFSSKRLLVFVNKPEEVEVMLCKGQNEPFIQGWISYKEKQKTPRWSVGFKKTKKGNVTFDTKFTVECLSDFPDLKTLTNNTAFSEWSKPGEPADDNDFKERCLLAKRSVNVSATFLYVNTAGLSDVEYAFYLIQDGKVLRKIGYQSDADYRFDNVRSFEGLVVKFYYKDKNDERASFYLPLDLNQDTKLLDINVKFDVLRHSQYNLSYRKYLQVSHYFRKSSASKKLLVTFHGSISPAQHGKPATALPVFRLFNLNISDQPSILCFSDKLLEEFRNNSVYLSWFLDTSHCEQSESIIRTIRLYCDLYDFEEIIFHGSSGGGFPSVRFASYFGQTAIVSNSQFILKQHSQFNELTKAVDSHGVKLQSYDLKSNLMGTLGPKKVISYCNVDDYTLLHHEYVNDIVSSLFPGSVYPVFFSGEKIANQKGIRNHSVQYPYGKNISDVLSYYLKGDILN